MIRTIQISEILTLLFVNISCGAGRRLQRASGQSEHNWLFGKGALKRQALKKISCIKGQYKINKELFELLIMQTFSNIAPEKKEQKKIDLKMCICPL